jgi:CheY-like chemotaxis protein
LVSALIIPMRANKILIVDDNMVFIEALTHLINDVLDDNCFIDFALNGELALEKVNKVHYEYIFIDIEMPGMSGIDITKKIDWHLFRRGIKIIAISNHTELAYREAMICAGASTYLVKDELGINELARIFKD